MKLINLVKTDINKVILSYGFWISVVITTLLCFTSTLYVDNNNKEYTIIEVLMNFNKDWLLSNISYEAVKVMEVGLDNKLSMFVTIVSAFPFISSFCDEINSNFIRYVILRGGKIKYYISKLLCSMITGGMAIALGYGIFCIIVSNIFPSINEYPSQYLALYLALYNEEITHYGQSLFTKNYYEIGNIVIIISFLIQMFLYGAYATIPSYILSSFIRNKYVLLSIPFILKYIFDMWCSKVNILIWVEGKIKNKIIIFLSNYCNLEILKGLFINKYIYIYVFSYIIIAILAGVIFSNIMKRRVDFGQ